MAQLSFADVRLNYDPSAPQQRFREAGLEAAFASPAAQLSAAPPWPADWAPKPITLTPPPAEADDPAALFTPGYPTSAWFEYRHAISAYLPLITGPVAPVNEKASDMARYFHSLGLYFLCQIRVAEARQRSTWQSRTPIRVSSLGGSRQCAIPTEQRKT